MKDSYEIRFYKLFISLILNILVFTFLIVVVPFSVCKRFDFNSFHPRIDPDRILGRSEKLVFSAFLIL